MNKYILQRLFRYEKAFAVFFLINIVFTIVNENLKMFSFEVLGYVFWLSLGLYLGILLAKREMLGAMKKLGK